jgi:hypothetical protein
MPQRVARRVLPLARVFTCACPDCVQRAVVRELDANQRDLEGMVKALETMEKTLQQYKQREVRSEWRVGSPPCLNCVCVSCCCMMMCSWALSALKTRAARARRRPSCDATRFALCSLSVVVAELC